MKTIQFLAGMVLLVMFLPSLVCGKTVNLEYSTYLNYSWLGRGIIVGTDGRAYVTGKTVLSGFPTENSYQAVHGGLLDAFVTCLSSTGSSLYYSTYLGGSDDDSGHGISLGTGGVAYVIGNTKSLNFPTVNPYQAGINGTDDAFVSALSSTGSSLYYSTYLGGSGNDYGHGISLGTDGRAYVVGYTWSLNFPTVNPYQGVAPGDADIFVTCLSSTGSALFYSTYLGGKSNFDYGKGISVGTNGRAYVTGYTLSSDFPTKNPYQASGTGVFVTALSSSGSTLYYSTYLGWGEGRGISLGSEGKAYITGKTDDSNFPTVNSYQPSFGGGGLIGSDAFVTAISSSGSSLYYSTYLGGSFNDYGEGISVGTDGRAYVTGYTWSADFPTENPYQAAIGDSIIGYCWGDVFVSALSPTGSALYYSTYLGGKYQDRGYGINVGIDGRVYVTGEAGYDLFPTVNSYQGVAEGSREAFVSQLILIPTRSQLTIDSGDYNGDGTSNIAIFRGFSGLWAIREITRIYFGSSIDEPVSGDYNGDGTTDIGIFRNSSGLWAIRGMTRLYFGSSLDYPVPGDYNGDTLTDIAIYRPSIGLWAARGIGMIYYGGGTDIPISGDYNGDGKSDVAIFRPESGLWAIRKFSRFYFGLASDIIVPGDYDGDNTWEPGIFRDTSGLWAIRGVTRSYYGSSIDEPIPADYIGDLKDDIGIFRETSGLWAIRGITRIYFGGVGDIPVTR